MEDNDMGIFNSIRIKSVLSVRLTLAFIALVCIHAPMVQVFSQVSTPTVEELVARALERNPSIQQANLEVKRQAILKRTAFDIPKTEMSLLYGQYNSIQKNDNNISVSQTIPFPTVFGTQHTLNKMLVRQSELRERITKNELVFQVKQLVNQFHYLKAREEVLLRQDSLLTHLSRIADLQFKTGEGTLLGKTTAQTQQLEMKNQLHRNAADKQTTLRHLQLISQLPELKDIAGTLENTALITIDTVALLQNPAYLLSRQNVTIAMQQKKVEVAQMLPDIRLGYFNQTLIGTQNISGQEIYYGSDKRFQGFQFGLSLPLFFAPHTSRIKSATLTSNIAQLQQESYRLAIEQQYTQATQELTKNKTSVAYYQDTALETAELITRQSKRSFESGELDYGTLLMNLRQALSIREEYLSARYQYNNSVITLQYLNGNNE